MDGRTPDRRTMITARQGQRKGLIQLVVKSLAANQ